RPDPRTDRLTGREVLNASTKRSPVRRETAAALSSLGVRHVALHCSGMRRPQDRFGADVIAKQLRSASCSAHPEKFYVASSVHDSSSRETDAHRSTVRGDLAKAARSGCNNSFSAACDI